MCMFEASWVKPAVFDHQVAFVRLSLPCEGLGKHAHAHAHASGFDKWLVPCNPFLWCGALGVLGPLNLQVGCFQC
jgi:hypothetical protein